MTSQERIKELRKRTGLSQTKFSNEYGIPVRTIQERESGRRNPPEYVLNLLEKNIENELNNSKPENKSIKDDVEFKENNKKSKDIVNELYETSNFKKEKSIKNYLYYWN